jgi:hypothetical protein
MFPRGRSCCSWWDLETETCNDSTWNLRLKMICFQSVSSSWQCVNWWWDLKKGITHSCTPNARVSDFALMRFALRCARKCREWGSRNTAFGRPPRVQRWPDIIEMWYSNVDESHNSLIFSVRKIDMKLRKFSSCLDAWKIHFIWCNWPFDLQANIGSFQQVKTVFTLRSESVPWGLKIGSQNELNSSQSTEYQCMWFCLPERPPDGDWIYHTIRQSIFGFPPRICLVVFSWGCLE